MVTIRAETSMAVEISVDGRDWLLRLQGGEWVLDPATPSGRVWIAQGRVHWMNATKRVLGLIT